MAKHNGCPECQSLYNAHTGCEGREQEGSAERRPASPIQNRPQSPPTIFNPFYTGRPRTPTNSSKHTPIDRQEIIRRIKSGGSRSTSPELERPASRTSLKKIATPSPEDPLSKPKEVSSKTPETQQDNEMLGQQIERPRSALHRGDFREKEGSSSAFERFGESPREEPAPALSTSPVAPWHSDFPSAAFRRRQQPPPAYVLPTTHQARPRTTSAASIANSFAYKPPTSPLVQASRPDTPEPAPRRASRSPDRSRRHTFSPQSLQLMGAALNYPTAARQPPTLRSERTYPYQAHQPRRSLNSFASLPQTPVPRSRRPSLSESPLHHATMVGSYEESILRGRMSTTPSKPLNFVAQIGVLGRGDCKASLRCPPHATIPFPAVFYSYGSGTRIATSTDQPSPYVGLIDLENNLPAANPSPEKRRQRLQATLSDEGSRTSSRTREDHSASDAHAIRRRRQKQKRRSGSPKAPPGGSYRIPQQGQLQIVIKNPNKTAVKLFLVPYDLSDMEAGQKTFIRQRSYSAGPIIDMPLSSRTNLGTDRPEASLPTSDDPHDRPMLRYLVHLHICCPSKGRYFLYKSVRVVFANRVPDGKERLRNEIQLPEPKYSTYKPGRDSNVGLAPHAAPGGNASAAAAVARRRSVLDPPATLDSGTPGTMLPHYMAQSLPLTEYNPQMDLSATPVPFGRNATPLATRHFADNMDVEPLRADETLTNQSQYSSFAFQGSSLLPGNKVRKLDEPLDFGREQSRERKVGARSESLLSMRLKDSAQQGLSGSGE